MTLTGAIHHLDTVKPNAFSQDEKVRWLSMLDGIIKTDLIDTHEGGDAVSFRPYDETTPLLQELLIPHPFDAVYIHWMEMQIDYANGEYGKFNNSVRLYEAAFEAYEKYYHRHHKPLATAYRNF